MTVTNSFSLEDINRKFYEIITEKDNFSEIQEKSANLKNILEDKLTISEEYKNMAAINQKSEDIGWISHYDVEAKNVVLNCGSNDDLVKALASVNNRIENAYGKGLLSDSEYKNLNTEFTDYSNRLLDNLEINRGLSEIGKEQSLHIGYYDNSKKMTTGIEFVLGMRDKDNSDYDKYRINRTNFFEKLNNYSNDLKNQ